MTVKEAAAVLGISPDAVRAGLETGAFRFGTVIPMKKKVYLIYRQRFETETGIKTTNQERSTKWKPTRSSTRRTTSSR